MENVKRTMIILKQSPDVRYVSLILDYNNNNKSRNINNNNNNSNDNVRLSTFTDGYLYMCVCARVFKFCLFNHFTYQSS